MLSSDFSGFWLVENVSWQKSTLSCPIELIQKAARSICKDLSNEGSARFIARSSAEIWFLWLPIGWEQGSNRNESTKSALDQSEGSLEILSSHRNEVAKKIKIFIFDADSNATNPSSIGQLYVKLTLVPTGTKSDHRWKKRLGTKSWISQRWVVRSSSFKVQHAAFEETFPTSYRWAL